MLHCAGREVRPLSAGNWQRSISDACRLCSPVPESIRWAPTRRVPEGVPHPSASAAGRRLAAVIERRTEAALRQLDHADLLEEFEASRCGL